MKISELMERLDAIRCVKGDLPVEVCIYTEMPYFTHDDTEFKVGVSENTDPDKREHPMLCTIG